jgi:hypothetical protein
MAAVARMEYAGVPIDTVRLKLLREHWEHIQYESIAEIDNVYQVFEGCTFSSHRFSAWLKRVGLRWPHHDSGRPDLSDHTFREMARIFPIVAPLRELRSSLADLRLNALARGKQGAVPFRAGSGPQRAVQYQVHLRSVSLAAWTDPAIAGSRPRLYRLVPTRIWNCHGLVPRPAHAGGLRVG